MIAANFTSPLLFMAVLSFQCGNPSIQDQGDPGAYAVVKSVKITGEEGSYTFHVELKSPDTGCDQYANWWEVITPGGELLYRRILGHAHVDEQPFTRSGGPVEISANQEVIIRAHMHPDGYGWDEIAMRGSVTEGFKVHEVIQGFAGDLEKQPPLPSGCAF